jgi:hypothetical protein
MSKSNTTKPVTVVSQIVAIMEKMKDSPMAATVEVLATKVLAKNGKPIGAARARAYYRDLVNLGDAPGRVERAVKAKAPKAPKAKVAKAPAVKAPADRKEVLKAAAKKAGIHADSIAAATGNDDPLGLAAPESLSMSDLKNIL